MLRQPQLPRFCRRQLQCKEIDSVPFQSVKALDYRHLMILDLADIPAALISDACSCFVTTPTKSVTLSETSTDTFRILAGIGIQVPTTTTTKVVAATDVVILDVPEGYELVPPGVNENPNCGWDVPGAVEINFEASPSNYSYIANLQGCAESCSLYYPGKLNPVLS